jgi:hypothetical protein
MSLKGFHIVFIVISTMLAIALGAWCIWINLVEGTSAYLPGAISSFVIAIALVIYGVWFYRKMKRLGIVS